MSQLDVDELRREVLKGENSGSNDVAGAINNNTRALLLLVDRLDYFEENGLMVSEPGL